MRDVYDTLVVPPADAQPGRAEVHSLDWPSQKTSVIHRLWFPSLSDVSPFARGTPFERRGFGPYASVMYIRKATIIRVKRLAYRRGFRGERLATRLLVLALSPLFACILARYI